MCKLSLNQNLTKWNSTTRTIWAYVDGSWQDTKIRGYIGSIPIYVSGVFEEQCDNGTHNATQASSAPSPFVESNSKLTTPNIGNYTLTTSNSIDLTNYSKLKVANNGVTKEVNIGSVSGQQYVYVYVNNTSASAYLEFGITSTLTWPVEASHRIVFGSATYASINDIQISEITIE